MAHFRAAAARVHYICLGREMAVQSIRNVGRLAANSCYFFLCDMQEKFRPTIRYYPEIITVADKMVSNQLGAC